MFLNFILFINVIKINTMTQVVNVSQPVKENSDDQRLKKEDLKKFEHKFFTIKDQLFEYLILSSIFLEDNILNLCQITVTKILTNNGEYKLLNNLAVKLTTEIKEIKEFFYLKINSLLKKCEIIQSNKSNYKEKCKELLSKIFNEDINVEVFKKESKKIKENFKIKLDFKLKSIKNVEARKDLSDSIYKTYQFIFFYLNFIGRVCEFYYDTKKSLEKI
ncbi:hypothetical protein TUBRATIS_009430 [Tubulinosema ratisbonensis]|uniref:Uncharacterized protein n=1 Tax=Tubulinosema ratisbonensis TaxID=291195 RepID=A0A437AN05_9MICR|nr:hypothetical protein TUBRATIS_009430 [Tubulinosema ratisbonensis]